MSLTDFPMTSAERDAKLAAMPPTLLTAALVASILKSTINATPNGVSFLKIVRQHNAGILTDEEMIEKIMVLGENDGVECECDDRFWRSDPRPCPVGGHF